MSDYSKEELARLIAAYNEQLMAMRPPAADIAPPSEQASPAPRYPTDMPPERDDPTAQEVPDNALLTEEAALPDTGFLQVQVRAAHQAIPIEGAAVAVLSSENGQSVLERMTVSDEDGLTPLIALPTKSRDLSMTPGNTKPYSSYTVEVTAEGYLPERFVGLPIYGGVTAVQNVSLIPLPDQGDDDFVLTYPQSGPTELD